MTDAEFAQVRADLQEEGRLKIQVTGYSMFPVIKDLEAVELEPVTESRIRRFDILVYYANHDLACHFVWRRSSRDILCRSYQFGNMDRIEPQMVLGRVTTHRLSFFQKLRYAWL